MFGVDRWANQALARERTVDLVNSMCAMVVLVAVLGIAPLAFPSSAMPLQQPVQGAFQKSIAFQSCIEATESVRRWSRLSNRSCTVAWSILPRKVELFYTVQDTDGQVKSPKMDHILSLHKFSLTVPALAWK